MSNEKTGPKKTDYDAMRKKMGRKARFVSFPDELIDVATGKLLDGSAPPKRAMPPPYQKEKQQSAYEKALVALRTTFQAIRPTVPLTSTGRVPTIDEILLPGIERADFEPDLRKGDGNELGGKFLSVHSSSALAVNTFGRFKRQPEALSLIGKTFFRNLRFERKCSAGIVGRHSPNLDVVVEGAEDIIAIEAKLTEHFRAHKAWFSGAYDDQIKDDRRNSTWFAEMCDLVEDADRYQFLDAAQLVKHAFGLARTFPELNVMLLYLYWEPNNASDMPELVQHRVEVKRFAERHERSFPQFKALIPALTDGD